MRRRGLSLLEAVVAGALTLLLGVALLSALPTALWAMTHGETLLQADQLAQSLLDAEQSRPFADLAYGSRELPAVEAFHTRLEIFAVGSDPDLLKGLRVTVWWQESGRRRQVVHELWISGLPRS